MHGRRLPLRSPSVVGHEDNITPPLVRIAHAVCERSRDARARVHDPHLILALVVPRRERLKRRKRVKQCAYNRIQS
jgi:hypothetical protein